MALYVWLYRNIFTSTPLSLLAITRMRCLTLSSQSNS